MINSRLSQSAISEANATSDNNGLPHYGPKFPTR